MLALIQKVDTETLKVWKLLDMEVIPTWVKDRPVLLGDAAHPFLPHQDQGGGCAIEDAALLAVVLPQDTLVEEIPARLKLPEKIRYERANRILLRWEQGLHRNKELSGNMDSHSKPDSQQGILGNAASILSEMEGLPRSKNTTVVSS
jgi:2-polyprenyl-6-methoxyphenol hydroxylase-like FAD-dependent oxidoreductase